MPKDYLFTSESVTEGHPDKIADQISDGVLDSILSKDPNGRVAVETLVKTGLAIVAGEVTTSCYVDIPSIVRSTICRIGYTDSSMGYDGNTMTWHGFRSIASTVLNERGYNPDAIEAQLAHVPKDKVRSAYNRAKYLPERVRIMQDWADHLDALKRGDNKITAFRRKRTGERP